MKVHEARAPLGGRATSVVLLDHDVQLSVLVVDVHAAALALAL